MTVSRIRSRGARRISIRKQCVPGFMAVLCLLMAVPGTPVRAVSSTGDSATAVWGQADFTSVTRRCTPTTSVTLCGPAQVAPDAHGDLWVADLLHNRVLMFPPGSAIASRVLGQYGSFRTRGCDQSPPRGSLYPAAPNRYTLCQPAGVAVDRDGTLYVADSLNNRILVYVDAAHKPPDAPADRVLGQSDFHATGANDVPAGGRGAYRCAAPQPASACTLNSPTELSLTPRGDLLVPDLDNHRVLLWQAAALASLRSHLCASGCPLPAGRVWGQYGSFRTTAANNPDIPAGSSPRCTTITPSTPASACTISEPWSAIADQRGDLFIADTVNNRVLEYDAALESGRQDADLVYGQEGSFVSTSDNLGGVSASSLWHPLGLTFDPAGNLWMTDYYNMRVLSFPAPAISRETRAGQVLGQEGQFTTNRCHLGPQGLCGPTGIVFDVFGHALVTDGFNNRVLAFFSSPISLARVDRLTVTRRGRWAVLRWHSAGPIRGFTLYEGFRRLTAHLLHPDRDGVCRYTVRLHASRSYTLHVLLSAGGEVEVATSA